MWTVISFHTRHCDSLSVKQQHTALTVLVARLSEGLSLGENDGHGQILEGGDVEEGGVLVVHDVFFIMRGCYVPAVREIGTGRVTGAKRDKKRGGEDGEHKPLHS